MENFKFLIDISSMLARVKTATTAREYFQLLNFARDRLIPVLAHYVNKSL